MLKILREMQLITTVRHHSTPTRITVVEKTIRSVSKVGEKLTPSYSADGIVK